MYTLLVVILHNIDLLPELLEAWKQAGIPGTTLLPSSGGFQAAKQLQRSGLSGLLSVFESNSPQQRMLLSLIDDKETLAVAISEAERVVGGFDRPNSGILFTLEVEKALGLRKWSQSGQTEKENQMKDRNKEKVDKGTENLLGWFEEEVRDLHGTETLTEWRKKRKQLLSVAIKSFKNTPTIVSADSLLKEVMQAFLSNPNVPIVSVINQEERLVGIIKEEWFAEIMLVPAMPEKFVKDPEQYDKALSFARMDPDGKAFDIMEDPVFINNEATLEEAYLELQEHHCTGLPVVNKHYRVTGYLTLTELMAVYFSGDEQTE